MIKLILLVALGQTVSNQVETVFIPHFNSYCEGQKVLSGPTSGEYIIHKVLNQQNVNEHFVVQQNVNEHFVDPTGFLVLLNNVRTQYGLRTVGYNSELTRWAHQNNLQQAIRGLGHYVLHPRAKQNSAMGGTDAASVLNMWMNSSGHRVTLLDPNIVWIGIASYGGYWTLNAE